MPPSTTTTRTQPARHQHHQRHHTGLQRRPEYLYGERCI